MTNPEPAKKPKSNLMVRITAAAVMVPVALLAAWLGGWFFNVFVGVLAVIMVMEWIAMVAHGKNSGQGTAQGAVKWHIIGIPYIALPLLALVLLRADPVQGLTAIILLFASVWTADTLAYFAGRTFGGPKLMPSVSPNKTWSGFFGAVFGGLIAAVLVFHFSGLNNLIAAAFIGAAIGGLEQGGDLFESAAKRHFGVKDSGSIIPGHGGVLDRVDGLMAAAVAAWVIGAVRVGSWENAASGLLNWSN